MNIDLNVIEKIELAIWDVDGVLVCTFSQTYETDCEILRKRGKQIPSREVYRENPHRGNWNAFYAHFGVTDGEAALREFYTLLNLKDIQAVPGVTEVLKNPRISQLGHAIASNNRDKRRVLHKLKSTGLSPFFEEGEIYVINGDKTTLLEDICDMHLVLPENAFFVSDTANDIIAGNNVGLTTIAIANDYSYDSLQMLLTAKPSRLLTDIRELPNLWT